MVSTKTVLVSVALVACHLPVAWTSARRSAGETSEEEGPRTARVISTISDVNLDGSYTYGFEASDGSYRKETRKVNGEISGEYGYIDPEGLLRTAVYGANRRTQFGFEPSYAIGGIPLLHPSFDQPAAAIILARNPYTQIQRNSEENRSSAKDLGFSDEDFTLNLSSTETEVADEDTDDQVEIYHPEVKSIEGRRAVVANRARRPLGRRRVKLLGNGKRYMVIKRERTQNKEEKVMQDRMETDISSEDSESKHDSDSKYDSEFSLNDNMSRRMTNLNEEMPKHQKQLKEENSKPEMKDASDSKYDSEFSLNENMSRQMTNLNEEMPRQQKQMKEENSKPEMKDDSELRKKPRSFIARAENNRLVRINPFKARQVTFGQRYNAFISRQKALKRNSLLNENPKTEIISNSLEGVRESRNLDINRHKSRNIVVDQNFSIQLALKKPMSLRPSFK